MIHKYHIYLFCISILVTLCIADTLSTVVSYNCNRTTNSTPLAPDQSDKAHIDKPPVAEFAQKPNKSRFPFIANQKRKFKIQDDVLCHPECNEGSLVLKRDSSPSAQNDRENPHGTVFATKDSKILYTLPNPENSGDRSHKGKFKIQDDVLCHPECNEGSLALKRDSSPSAQNDREKSKTRSPQYTIKENYGRLPLYFIQNDGQTDEKVRFYANAFGETLFATKYGEILYALE